MNYEFSCPRCGYPLEQKTVLFDILYSENSGPDKSISLYINEKNLKKWWRKKRGTDRYIISLSWKKFWRYMSDLNNLNDIELCKLTLDEAIRIVESEPQKKPREKQPPIFRRLCNAMPIHKELHAFWLLRNIVQLFKEREKSFELEVKPVIDSNLIVGLELYDGTTGDRRGVSDRRCKECKEAIFKQAGTGRSSTVIFAAGKACFEEQKQIVESLSAYLCREECGSSHKCDIEKVIWKEKKEEYYFVTLQVECGEKKYLTLVVAPDEYRDKDRVCFFPKADAFVLCDANAVCSGLTDQEIENKNGEAQRYVRQLQGVSRKRRERDKKNRRFAPVLLLYGTDGRMHESGCIEPDTIFSSDKKRAEDFNYCKKFRNDFLREFSDEIYYTQLFYGSEDKDACIKKLGKWILLTTRCVPARAMPQSGSNEVVVPFYKNLLPGELISRHGGRREAEVLDAVKAEAEARLYLFDNSTDVKAYLDKKNLNQVKHLEHVLKCGKKGHKTDGIGSWRKIIPRIPAEISDEWETAEKLIENQKGKDGSKKIITFLIGNGFDVGMKLKSEYGDFYKLYTDENSEYYPGKGHNQDFKDVELANKLRDAKVDKRPDWSYYEKWLGNMTFDPSYKDPTNRKKLMEQNRNFQKMFFKYLNERQSKMIFAVDVTEEDESGEKIFMRRLKVQNQMKAAVESFYQEKQVTESGHKAVSAVLGTEHTNHRFQFVCFNYSAILDNCVGCVSGDTRFGEVYHVHGELAKEEIGSALVMGVNDISQIGEHFRHKTDGYLDELVKWKFMKKKKRTEQYEKGVQMIWESDVIVVYGMSLGETDKVWWQIINKWLEENDKLIDKRQLIFYVYTKEDNIEEEWLTSFRKMTLEAEGLASKKCSDTVGETCAKDCKESCECNKACEAWNNRKKYIHFAIGKEVHEKMFMMDLRIRPNEDDGKTVAAV